MPFVKRTIQPIKIGSLLTTGSLIQTNNKTRHQSVNNELEQVTVTSLIDVMRQLSCLSLHVQDMFGELQRETTIIFERTMQLNRKVESLRKEIGQLNPIVEEVSLHDINLRKPFKFSTWKDQQIVTHSTRPQCISYVYSACDPPPLLQLLNTCRSDGKDSLKFYTDPSYFFDLWCQAMQKESKTQMKRHKKHK
ncbi:hypothetical protein HELRODRAFT_87558, partial [Helobdella robusta]|uniref:Wiskott-Aldrich syndrome protein family member n=1 Tax=Helobdella robusta TaxID=6412 RepID=T1G6S2_HELRO